MPGGPPTIGDHVAHYRLAELLARDNAFYFRAIDSRNQGAVRLTISVGRFSPDEARGLLPDAVAATGFSHPNIARVFEAGESERRLWIASELVHGTTLEQALREKGSLPMRDAAAIAGQVASGLAAAHGHGALHLGLRPANVLLVGEIAKVIDLGAHALLSGQGRPYATPCLMAPEQVSGTRTKPDARTDIYILGALLFQLLAGVPPFDGKTFDDIVGGILTAAPPRLRALKPRAAPLEAIVNRALEKKPEARFQTMTELAIALGEVVRAPSAEVSDDPVYRVSLRDPSTQKKAPETSRPEPAGASAAQNTWAVAPPVSVSLGDGQRGPIAERAGAPGDRVGDRQLAVRAGDTARAAPASAAPALRADASAMTLNADTERPRITREVSGPVPQPVAVPSNKSVRKGRTALLVVAIVGIFALLAALGFLLR